MKVRFLKLSDEKHRLEIWRDDGSLTARDCETRSMLRHDLMHFAFESTLGLTKGFWGHMARGQALPSIGDPEVLAIERAVAMLQSGTRNAEAPAAVMEKFRQLMGHWKATPYGQAMELEWK